MAYIEHWETVNCRLRISGDASSEIADLVDDEDIDIDFKGAGITVFLGSEEGYLAGKLTSAGIQRGPDPEDPDEMVYTAVITEVTIRGVGSREAFNMLRAILAHTEGFLQAVAFHEGGDVTIINCQDGKVETVRRSSGDIARALVMNSFRMIIDLGV